MAALRRLIPRLTGGGGGAAGTTSRAAKALKVAAAASCVAAAAAGAAYYYRRSFAAGRRSGLRSRVEARLFDLALPSVSATDKDLDKMLADTPPVWKGSSNLFRNLREREPRAGFKIAFNMFDADGNEMVDKREFLVLEEIFRKKKVRKEAADDEPRFDRKQVDEKTETTLLVHFFGKKGKAELKFEDFYEFMDNLQTEMLEIEFLSYCKGLPTISEEDFARILLRFTNVDDVTEYLENVRHGLPDEKGITFEEFRSFFQFLNNLEDFTIAMQMYNFANRSLSRHLVNTVFKIFDEDRDDKLSHKEFIGVMKERLHRRGGVLVRLKFFRHHNV
ncbi:Calcium uptake protein 3, mitochondrial [Liparis tanakae]|uniref:Calcium uptake protein 3, mitochondrial n=1 Tax=Liparis tanakae TaxID=230148 RepID=A0A4Z2GE69_9TELE|nr:Calcium uptake protein 3, mitochondrial [Liparis tanakae]